MPASKTSLNLLFSDTVVLVAVLDGQRAVCTGGEGSQTPAEGTDREAEASQVVFLFCGDLLAVFSVGHFCLQFRTSCHSPRQMSYKARELQGGLPLCRQTFHPQIPLTQRAEG